MKAVISAKEFKAALKSLKAIAESFQSKEDVSYFFKIEKSHLTLQMFNGVFACYKLAGDLTEINPKPFGFDFSLVASLKFPEDAVSLTFSDSLLRLASGSLMVEVGVLVCDKLPKVKSIDLNHEFPREPFVTALDFHNYGLHHNPIEASKRPLQVSNRDGFLFLQSFDRQVSAFSKFEYTGEPLEAPIYFLPNPVSTVLKSVTADTFKLGIGKQVWGIKTGNLETVYPNMIKPQVSDFSKILEDVKSKPCLMLRTDGKVLAKALDVLSPSIKAGKEENPKMALCLGDKIYFELQSTKIKAMRIELEQCKIQEKDMLLSREKLPLNFRYVKEFVDNLATLADGEITLQWWKFKDETAPLSGRAISVFNKAGRYLIARLTP